MEHMSIKSRPYADVCVLCVCSNPGITLHNCDRKVILSLTALVHCTRLPTWLIRHQQHPVHSTWHGKDHPLSSTPYCWAHRVFASWTENPEQFLHLAPSRPLAHLCHSRQTPRESLSRRQRRQHHSSCWHSRSSGPPASLSCCCPVRRKTDVSSARNHCSQTSEQSARVTKSYNEKSSGIQCFVYCTHLSGTLYACSHLISWVLMCTHHHHSHCTHKEGEAVLLLSCYYLSCESESQNVTLVSHLTPKHKPLIATSWLLLASSMVVDRQL
jgi:hypothetical protein